MAAFTRILMCYDATREGRRALREGKELALECRAQTHLLAVLDQSPLQWGADIASAIPYEAAQAAAKEILEDGVTRLRALGLEATGHFAVGRAVDEIARASATFNADLIVLGHHRRGPFKRWWEGRDDRQLLDRVSCSVLVVTAPEAAEAAAV
jgi:nucleotide-binding universal stress UspA family protein